MQANKRKQETRSEIENARVNEAAKRSTGELPSEGKKRTSMGAGVITVMAITQLTSRGRYLRGSNGRERKRDRERGEKRGKSTVRKRDHQKLLLCSYCSKREKCLWFLFGGVYPLSVFHLSLSWTNLYLLLSSDTLLNKIWNFFHFF